MAAPVAGELKTVTYTICLQKSGCAVSINKRNADLRRRLQLHSAYATQGYNGHSAMTCSVTKFSFGCKGNTHSCVKEITFTMMKTQIHETCTVCFCFCCCFVVVVLTLFTRKMAIKGKKKNKNNHAAQFITMMNIFRFLFFSAFWFNAIIMKITF